MTITLTLKLGIKGGSGSGNFGHAGRPGKLGGSVVKGAANTEIDPRGSITAIDMGIYAGDVKPIRSDATTIGCLEREVTYGYGYKKQGTQDQFTETDLEGQYKNTIVTELSAQTGIEYDEVNRFVKQWSNTSNDTDMRSLSIQKAVADEFGLELSSWQKNRMSDLKYPNQKIAIYQRQNDKLLKQQTKLDEEMGAIRSQYGATLLGSPERAEHDAKMKPLLDQYDAIQRQRRNNDIRISDLANITAARKLHIFASHADPDGDARKLVRAMYDNQQKLFQAKGITHVTLFRGVETPFAQRRNMQTGDTVKFTGNAVESWAAKSSIAYSFSGRNLRGGIVMSVRVPVERVLTSAATGLGCLGEFEYLVLGSRFSNDKAHIMRVGFSKEEQIMLGGAS